jgi:Fe2+ transport system protein FeoA
MADGVDAGKGDPIRTAADSIPIGDLTVGRCGIVREVLAGGDALVRLMAMGVCAGRRVMLVRRGDPLVLRVLGARIGVSSRLAERVRVTPCTESWCDRE